MKNKILVWAIAASSLLTMPSCLDMEPVSSITDANMWKNEGQYTSFVYGVHSRLRESNACNLYKLGEWRSDIFYSGDNWTGESNKIDYIAANNLSAERTGLSNYADLYSTINQLNLFISKAVDTNLLSEKDKAYYLGEMYGLRAFLYFHLLRSWGDVVWIEEPSTSFDITSLDRPVTPAAEIMDKIKADIQSSTDRFGTDYSFKNDRAMWSKAATLMLKAEVYLWSSRQMGGGAGDAQIALEALDDIQNNISRSTLDLMPDFADIFSYEEKGNKEIIFAIRHQYQELNMFNNEWRNNMVPQRNTLSLYYDMETGAPIDVKTLNFNGNMYYPLQTSLYNVFETKDTRQKVTLKAVYEQAEPHDYVGCFAYKYQGTTIEGTSDRLFADDYPIYRYADLLLMKAEAKSLTNGDPAAEINEVRKRAYGDNYDETVAYPTVQDNADGINEVLLKERFKEFMFEGKRWYDLRRFGNEYVFKYTTANAEYPKRLLWPIDKTTLTNNRALNQTDGY